MTITFGMLSSVNTRKKLPLRKHACFGSLGPKNKSPAGEASRGDSRTKQVFSDLADAFKCDYGMDGEDPGGSINGRAFAFPFRREPTLTTKQR